MLDAKLRAIGNSQGIIIPRPVLRMLDLNKGDKLEIEKTGKKLILKKVVESNDKVKNGK